MDERGIDIVDTFAQALKFRLDRSHGVPLFLVQSS
jgi:hypothetical protein